ncbi:MAG: DUF3048 domain-containing protein [Paenisporosarcina sp.]
MKKYLLVVFAVLLISGCSKDKDKATDVLKNDEEKEIEVVDMTDEEVILPFQAPFSGIRGEKEFTNRPVLVTINNHPHARPQSGIAQADIVYEMIAEANVTRLLALYQSELPERIGPVRSARDYFIEIADGLDAFYVAHGYSPEARQILESGVIDHINGMQYDGTLFTRSSDRKAPHNSYTSAEQVMQGMEIVGATTEIEKIPPFSYYESAEGAKMGTIASVIDVRFGISEDFHHVYTYDTLTQQYSRSSGGHLTTDKDTLEQVSLSNVMFFEVPHQTIDNQGRQQLNLTSGGRAYLFQAGIMKEIEWQQIDGILVPMEEGLPAMLVPGKSWVHLVKTKPGMEQMVTFSP